MSAFVGCNEVNSTQGISENFIPVSEMLGQPQLPFWANTLVLTLFLVVFRTLGYLVLRYIRQPK